MKQNNPSKLIQIITFLLLLLTLGVHILTVVGQVNPDLLWYGTVKHNEALRLAGLFSTILYLLFLYALYIFTFKRQNYRTLMFSKTIFTVGIVYFVFSAVGSFRADTIFHKSALTLFYLIFAFLFYLLWLMAKTSDKKKKASSRKKRKR